MFRFSSYPILPVGFLTLFIWSLSIMWPMTQLLLLNGQTIPSEKSLTSSVTTESMLSALFFRVIAVGAKDMQTRIVAAEKYQNLFIYSLGGHTSPIVKSFFEKESLDVSVFCVDVKGISFENQISLNLRCTLWKSKDSLVFGNAA